MQARLFSGFLAVVGSFFRSQENLATEVLGPLLALRGTSSALQGPLVGFTSGGFGVPWFAGKRGPRGVRGVSKIQKACRASRLDLELARFPAAATGGLGGPLGRGLLGLQVSRTKTIALVV